jgi:hypothetical protein
MNAALVAAAGITAVAVFFFLVESDGLSQIHARVRTQLFNTARWAFVIALTWLLIPATFSEPSSDRPVVIVGMVGLAGALMLVPVRWVVRIGGREPAWELRSARLEVARLANRARRDPASATPERITQTMARIEQLRTAEVRELCDLMLSELEDLQAGDEAWNEAGRRSIRIDQLSRRLWPGEVPPPEFDPDEATFRWRLYRTFGRLMEVGAMERSADTAARFQQLLAALDEFRRSDTKAFIADVRRSGNRWLKSDRKRGPWIESYDFSSLGPRGLEEVRSIWGRDAALWGAQLDDDDMRALEEDLARRAPGEGAAVSGPDSAVSGPDSAAPMAGAPAGTR